MGVNITVDGLTYSGVEQMYVGGKSLAFSAAVVDVKGIIDGTASVVECSDVETVFYGKFSGCISLISASFPALKNVYNNAFENCNNMTSFYAPQLASIGMRAFQSVRLSDISFPECTYISGYAFYRCSWIENVSLPSCSQLNLNTFVDCVRLQSAHFNVLNRIDANVFYGCQKLLDVHILASQVATLTASGAFTSTPIAGYTAQTGGVLGSIYVPASLLTAYQSATNWAFFSERFVGI